MAQFKTECDMGSIKIYNESMSCFFANGFGDGTNKVTIGQRSRQRVNKYEFLGHFSVKTIAFLSEYDCADTPLYEFQKGRWFVYLVKPQEFYIEKVDEDTHA